MNTHKDKKGSQFLAAQKQALKEYIAQRAGEAFITEKRRFIDQEGNESKPTPQLEAGKAFKTGTADAVRILYTDWNGRPYRNPEAATDATRFFCRYRLAPWHETPDMKYWQPKGTGIHIYGNAIYWYFVRHGITTPTIVFCEGEFKAETLSAHGIPAVAIAGIGGLTKAARVEAEVMLDQLKPARTVMLYDQDAFANQYRIDRAHDFAKSACGFLKFCKEVETDGRVLIPTKRLEGKGIDDALNQFENPNRIITAIAHDRESDYFERYTERDRSQLYARLLSSTAGPDGFNTKREADQIADVEKYIGEAQYEITEAIQQQGQVLMKAPTGRGKTTTAIKIAQAWPGRAVIIAPLTSIVDREVYNRPDIAALTGRTSRDDVDKARSAQTTFTTVDQFWKIADTLEKGDLIIYDEADYLPRNHDWKSFNKKAEIDRVIAAVSHSRFVLAMTATPPPIIYDNWHWIEVVPRDKPAKPELHHVHGKGRIQAAANEIAEAVKQGKAIARIQSKQDLADLKTLLIETNPDLESQIEVLTSEDKQTSETYKAIAGTGLIPDHCKVLLVTGLIDYGLSIANTDVAAMIAIDSQVNHIDAATFRQFVARTRAVNFPVKLIAAERDGQPINAERLYRSLRQDADEMAEAQQSIWTIQQNSLTPLDGDMIPHLTGERMQHTYFDESAQQFRANPAGIFATVNKYVRRTVNTDRLIEDLSQDFIIAGHSIAGAESQIVTTARKERKAQRKQERERARELLFEYGSSVIESDDWPDTDGAKMEAKRVRALQGYEVMEAEIPELLENHQQNRKWGRLIKSIAFEYGQKNPQKLNTYAQAEMQKLTTLKQAIQPLANQKINGQILQKAAKEAGLQYTQKAVMEATMVLFTVSEAEKKTEKGSTTRFYTIRENQQYIAFFENVEDDELEEPPF